MFLPKDLLLMDSCFYLKCVYVCIFVCLFACVCLCCLRVSMYPLCVCVCSLPLELSAASEKHFSVSEQPCASASGHVCPESATHHVDANRQCMP